MPFKEWSRVALVVDSDIEDVKYLLEISDKGFKMHEFISRMMHLKNESKIFAIKFFNHKNSNETK